MTTNVVLDSNVLIAMFLQGDAHWQKSRFFLQQMMSGEYKTRISVLALPEVCGAVQRITQDNQISKKMLKSILLLISAGLLEVEELTFVRMEEATSVAINFGLKGADAVPVALAKETDSYLLTFDNEVIKKTRTHIKILEL